jgi:MFS family permease
MSDTPAGWFPDPFGRYERRFWDGTAWTAHVGTGNQQLVDPLGATLSIPIATPPTAFPATTPPPATTAPDGSIPFLDRMGPEARLRPDPEAGLALAGIGGFVAAVGLLALILGDDDSRGKLVLFGLLVFGAALAVRLLIASERYVRGAAVGAGAAGLAGLIGSVTWDSSDSAWASLLFGAAFIAAWALPGFLGRPLFLGLGVLAVVVSIGQALSDNTTTFIGDVRFTNGVVGDQGAVFLLLAIVLLGGVFFLDRRGYHGVATALVIPALISTAIGVGDTLSRIDNETGGAILVIVAGVVIALVGGYGERRATTWIGALVASVGVVGFLFSIVDPDAATSVGTTFLLSGAALIATPIVIQAIRQNRAATPPTTPTAPANGPTTFDPPTV